MLAKPAAGDGPSDAADRWERVTSRLDPPFAAVDLDAFDANARDLVRRANGVPIRVVTKSLRCRRLIERVLAQPGYRGIMCYSLPEALWLHGAGVSDDILVAYPTAHREALRTLAADSLARQHITITVDTAAHLDFVDQTLGQDHPDIRLSLELDVSWRPLPLLPPVGTLRSPLREPAQAVQFAEEVLKRPGFRLAGVMGYEGQIAGLGDAPPGRPFRARLLQAVQGLSARELAGRRAETVRRIRELTDLEFVNGGGTGSLESTSADDSVTELAAGSGLVGPTLFDAYRRFSPEPALMFALPVVRRPAPGIATLFSGGYVASGTGTPDRLPRPFLPRGLKLTRTEGAGEVQTPVLGDPADRLSIGDRAWLRHAKGGELAERFTEYHLFSSSGEAGTESVPTYRGEGKCFG